MLPSSQKNKKKPQHKTNTKKEEENPNQFCTNASIAMF